MANSIRSFQEDLKEKVMTNLSTRARDTLNEEMSLGAGAPAQVRQARTTVVEVIERLDQEGKLVMLD